jgi:hypothetical protein
MLFRRKPAPAPVVVSTLPECTPIADAPRRQRINVTGKVMRMQSRPAQSLPTVVISVVDGTGTATATFTGRRSIGGLELGRKVILTGVGVDTGTLLTFVNPEFTLLP